MENSLRLEKNERAIVALQSELAQLRHALRLRNANDPSSSKALVRRGECKRRKRNEDTEDEVDESDKVYTVEEVIDVRSLGNSTKGDYGRRKLIHLADGQELLVWRINLLRPSIDQVVDFSCHDGNGSSPLAIFYKKEEKSLRFGPNRVAANLFNSVFNVDVELVVEDNRAARKMIGSKSFKVKSLGGVELCRISEEHYEEFNVDEILTVYVTWRCAHNFDDGRSIERED